ncbi:colicin D domain-containing protein [Plantactinospora endophytica]|uniref:colicin D domain-containing protein n=1 Tax=Plantactinospora endophytica TaxID=673535 RepID=UPI001EF20696|nr:colicin D domain-containing protein [Plantactinospora endophytica]
MLTSAVVLLTAGLGTPARASSDDPPVPYPLLSYQLSVDGANPGAIELGSEVELEARLQNLFNVPALVHHRFSVNCYEGAEVQSPDLTVLVPPAPYIGGGVRVPVEHDLTIPWDCVAQTNPLRGYNGNFYLETGRAEDDYNQSAIIFFSIKLPEFTATPLQLQKKYKHAKDFDITANYNPAMGPVYEQALRDFIAAPGTLRVTGTYHRAPSILSYNPTDRRVVVQTIDGAFVTAFRMSPRHLWHVQRDRALGGSGGNFSADGSEVSAGSAGPTAYLVLLEDFVTGRTSADQFEVGFLDAFRTDDVQHPEATSAVLDSLFFQVDVYYGDPALRAEGDIDADQLETAAIAALASLGVAVN